MQTFRVTGVNILYMNTKDTPLMQSR